MLNLRSGRGAELAAALDRCPPGIEGWRAFEHAALDALRYLFVPPLNEPYVQVRSLSGIERRDAIFPNRVMDPNQPWGLLRQDLSARLIPVEFKNYSRKGIGKQEVDQTRNYLKQSMGRLAIICSKTAPVNSAYRRRNGIFAEEKKVILFISASQLRKLLDLKDRGADPGTHVVDSVEKFLIEHD
jgi:hypothetical protein